MLVASDLDGLFSVMTLDPCATTEAVTVAALQQRMLTHLAATAPQTLPLTLAADYILASPILARIANPRFDNSAMDGFALGADVLAKLPGKVNVSGSQLAGHEATIPVPKDGAMAITTGAKLPPGTVAVVMQEHCTFDPPELMVHHPVSAEQFIRRKGADIQPGQVLAEAGMPITAPLQLLLASQGVTAVSVYKPPVVAVLSSGDELRDGGQALGDSHIYDANRTYLIARLQQAGAVVKDFGILPDQRGPISDALQQAADEADLIVSSGGVSVGPADWLKQCVSELGSLLHWRVPIRPGKPLAWGRVGHTPFIGLPGNPLSALVGGELFMLPVIRRLRGLQHVLPEFVSLPLRQAVAATGEREQYLCAQWQLDNGTLSVMPLPQQGSASLAQLPQANALIRIAANSPQTAPGKIVDVLPF